MLFFWLYLHIQLKRVEYQHIFLENEFSLENSMNSPQIAIIIIICFLKFTQGLGRIKISPFIYSLLFNVINIG